MGTPGAARVELVCVGVRLARRDLDRVGIPSALRRLDDQVGQRGGSSPARARRRPAAEDDLAALLRVAARGRRSSWVMSTTIATSGASENAAAIAPAWSVSSCIAATATTSPSSPPARRRASPPPARRRRRRGCPSRSRRSGRSGARPVADEDADVAGRDAARAPRRASLGADVDVQLVHFAGRDRARVPSARHRRRAITPGTSPPAAEQRHALTDHRPRASTPPTTRTRQPVARRRA